MPNPFESYEQVEATMKEYITKPPYEVEVCALKQVTRALASRDATLTWESRRRLPCAATLDLCTPNVALT